VVGYGVDVGVGGLFFGVCVCMCVCVCVCVCLDGMGIISIVFLLLWYLNFIH